MRVSRFEVSTGAQNCQWFQGIVPVFGNGWDPSAFDTLGMPVNTTLNGMSFPNVPNIHNSGVWNWWTNVTYHGANPLYSVGDYDNDGSLEMCHTALDPGCSGPGIPEACCGPCWGSPGPNHPGNGTLLPPGWFSSGVDGICPLIGWPTVDWGDGNTCNGVTGPWNFCFTIATRSFPECLNNSSFTDLTLAFFPFGDGEVGSWTGGPSICGMDTSVRLDLTLVCGAIEVEELDYGIVCSSEVFEWPLSDIEIEEWQWHVESPPGVQGGVGGSAPGDTVLRDTLVNMNSALHTLIYTFIGYSNNELVKATRVSVGVAPAISVSFESLCFMTEDTIDLAPILNGSLDDYTYEWHDGSTDSVFHFLLAVYG
jgi:hypothetical protein